MEEGLYESVLTTEVAREVEALSDLHAELVRVDSADQAHVLARHLSGLLHQRLTDEKDPDRRLALAQKLLVSINGDAPTLAEPVRQLHAVRNQPAPGLLARYQGRPKTPLNDAALLTNAHGEPSLAAELKAEIESADRIDLLCAFVMWRGLRLLEDPLSRAREAGVPLRVVDHDLHRRHRAGSARPPSPRLRRRGAGPVRRSTHAPSRQGLAVPPQHRFRHRVCRVFQSLDERAARWGRVERAAVEAATPALLQKFEATFDTYWNSAEFEPYDPERDRDRLDDALALARGKRGGDRVTISISGPRGPAVSRTSRRCWTRSRSNASFTIATETWSSRRPAPERPWSPRWTTDDSARDTTRPKLLFVAHRREILEQSLRTYREVLGDGDFGELYVGGTRPERWQHVFASVQSLTSYGVANIPADAFDIVVIDEFHHAEAKTYRRHPRSPSAHRAPGAHGDARAGRRSLTCARSSTAEPPPSCGSGTHSAPTCCARSTTSSSATSTDLRSIAWSRGRYDEDALDNVFTGNDARARSCSTSCATRCLTWARCAPSGSASASRTPSTWQRCSTRPASRPEPSAARHRQADREQALADLRARRVNALFAADLFNEGLDIPDVDTVLFLRPTESATVFLQQLGRGLRRTHDKAVLTVLDFVGYHRKEFRFDQKLRALTGDTRRRARAAGRTKASRSCRLAARS